jgi:hypothetical protein
MHKASDGPARTDGTGDNFLIEPVLQRDDKSVVGQQRYHRRQGPLRVLRLDRQDDKP